jgi:glycosyltransferase involved in cell wall biosynthesis
MAAISIVMAVYNGAATLTATMDSILAQTETDFELVAVDDGSTDATPSMLAGYATRDPRVRVITQPNGGLTRALIRGCAGATGALIARHDCGDRSHPERLRRQRELLDAHPGVVLVTCSTLFLGPGGEPLYVVETDGAEIRRSLLHDGIDDIRGLTHHGTAMFRRDAYVAAGGYRAEFRVAQDLDLWLRMAPLGEIAVVPDVLYEAVIDVGSISANRRDEQVASAAISLQWRDATTEDERAALLQQAAAIVPQKKRAAAGEARALYFIASCLRRTRHPHWTRYARRAIRRDPLYLRAWLLLLRWR